MGLGFNEGNGLLEADVLSGLEGTDAKGRGTGDRNQQRLTWKWKNIKEDGAHKKT